MPVLHKYRDKDGYYVLTSINKSMVTFQLTPKGQERLLSSGIHNEEKSLGKELGVKPKVYTLGGKKTASRSRPNPGDKSGWGQACNIGISKPGSASNLYL